MVFLASLVPWKFLKQFEKRALRTLHPSLPSTGQTSMSFLDTPERLFNSSAGREPDLSLAALDLRCGRDTCL
jgi:hypothetical protein